MVIQVVASKVDYNTGLISFFFFLLLARGDLLL